MMVVFLVGLFAGLVVGFVIGAVWMAAAEHRMQARLREWAAERGEEPYDQEDEDR
jgi:hypothetical protein